MKEIKTSDVADGVKEPSDDENSIDDVELLPQSEDPSSSLFGDENDYCNCSLFIRRNDMDELAQSLDEDSLVNKIIGINSINRMSTPEFNEIFVCNGKIYNMNICFAFVSRYCFNMAGKIVQSAKPFTDDTGLIIENLNDVHICKNPLLKHVKDTNIMKQNQNEFEMQNKLANDELNKVCNSVLSYFDEDQVWNHLNQRNNMKKSYEMQFAKSQKMRENPEDDFNINKNMRTSRKNILTKSLYHSLLKSQLQCNNLVSFGNGDEEKKYCVRDQDLSADCIIFSLGSNNQFDFEKGIIERTNCLVYIFDCTVNNWKIPKEIITRVKYFSVCLGEYDTITDGRKFESYKSILRYSKGRKPKLMKIDIEGYEYDAISTMLFDARKVRIEENKDILPDQIAMEVHNYRSPQRRQKDMTTKPFEIYHFGELLHQIGGYAFLHERKNPINPNHSEILLVKVFC